MLKDLDIKIKKISSFKRIAIFIIDATISFMVFIILFLSIGNISIIEIEKENIKSLNEIYIKECLNMNIPYTNDNQYGLVEIDFSSFMDQKINEGHTYEDAYSMYNETDSLILNNLENNTTYVASYNSFYVTYNLTTIIMMFISLFIFQLLIPILNKKPQTLGMKIFKTTIVDSKNNIIISNKQTLLRFFTIFVSEFVLVYILVNCLGLIFVILASFFSISLTKRKSSLHDLILKTDVTYLEYSYTE